MRSSSTASAYFSDRQLGLGLLAGCATLPIGPRRQARLPRVGYLASGGGQERADGFRLGLRSTELDKLLDPGPRQDMKRIFERARSEQIAWISQIQRLILDWFLKANHVEEGVRSYSRIVLLTAGTKPYWDRFR